MESNNASPTSPDPLGQRLHSLGLPLLDGAASHYRLLLRNFFRARLTKADFEDALRKHLTGEQLTLHNAFIRDLCRRVIHEPQPGAPPLPSPQALAANAQRHAADLLALKPFGEDDLEVRLHTEQGARVANRKRVASSRRKRRPAENDDTYDFDRDDAASAVPMRTTRRSEKRRRSALAAEAKNAALDETGRPTRHPSRPLLLPRQRVSAARRGAFGTVASPDRGLYPALPFFPTAPGECMDIELFLKLRMRALRNLDKLDALVTHAAPVHVLNDDGTFWPSAVQTVPGRKSSQALRTSIMGVRDDAIALLTHAVEVYIKNLFQAASR